MKLRALLVLTLLLLGACQTTQVSRLHVDEVLRDDLFPDASSIPIESVEDIFALNPAIIEKLKPIIAKTPNLALRRDALIDELFDQSVLNLRYENSANTTASETSEQKQANCLSMSILAYSMAQYIGLEPVFQEVHIPEAWVRRDGFSMLNGHVNLKLKMQAEKKNVDLMIVNGKEIVIDFDPEISRYHFPTNKIDKSRIVAMFYNNKGADALVQNNILAAYAYFRAAMRADSTFVPTYGNIGIAYRMSGHYDAARDSYEAGLVYAPNHTNLLENLAVYYSHIGQPQKAEALYEKVVLRRINNPYYHFILGEEAMSKGRYDEALDFYRRANSLNNKNHAFHFGLAKAWAMLGDYDRSERELLRARRYADNVEDEQKYTSKLQLFAGIR